MSLVATALPLEDESVAPDSLSVRVLDFPFDATRVRSLQEAVHAFSRSTKLAEPPFDLTVIVPIFNTRRYVLDALRSVLLAARGLSLQIICVNDGSTDDSLELVADFLRDQDCRTALLIDQPNRGPGPARNVALPFVRGEYVASLDSDDLIDPSGYTALLAFAREFDCDVVWGRTQCFTGDLHCRNAFSDSGCWDWILDGRAAVVLCPRFDHRPIRLEVQPNPRIVRTAFLKRHKILYPACSIGEDLPYHVALMNRAHRIALVNMAVSHYRQGRSDQQTQDKSLRRFDLIPAFAAALDEMIKSNPSAEHAASFLSLAAYKILWCSEFLPLALRREFFEQICKEFNRVPKPWIGSFFQAFSDFHVGFVVWCLAHGKTEGLLRRSARARTPWLTVRFLYQVHGARKVLSLVKDAP